MRIHAFSLLTLSILSAQTPQLEQTLQGDTLHVQGLLVTVSTAFVTSVDRAARRAFVFEYDLASGARLRQVDITAGACYHPGGFDADDTSLWIPVAEYRAASRTVIQRRSRTTLELISTFDVPDHIGALAVAPDRLFLANWDARLVYEYSFSGALLRTRPNPTEYRIQDWKFRAGSIVASAVAPKGQNNHGIVWFDPETLLPLDIRRLSLTDRNVPFTNEGLDYRDGAIYLLPEDTPSRLFRLRWE